jgi:hypothetical protein
MATPRLHSCSALRLRTPALALTASCEIPAPRANGGWAACASATGSTSGDGRELRILALQAQNQARFPQRRGLSTRLDLVRPKLDKIWMQGEALNEADAVPESPIYL